MVSSSVTTPRSGVYYFSQGWKLIGLPGIRRYVFLPLLVNIILMGGAFWWLFTRLDSWIPSLMSHVPEWLQWLNYLLWPMVVISILLVFGYFFSTIANWIAAPFSGLLAEQLEARLTGATPPDVGVFGIMKDVPRIMKREWQKFAWYLPRAIVLCFSTLSPVSARPSPRCCGSCSAPGCWRFSTAITLLITIRCRLKRCVRRCARAK
jgi:CysZ protein